MKDHVADLYKALVNGGYNVDDLGGSIDGFREAMSDSVMRKEFYDWVGRKKNFRLPDYDTYESALASTYDGLTSEVTTEESQPTEEAPKKRITMADTLNASVPGMVSADYSKSVQEEQEKNMLTQEEKDQRAAMRERLQADGTIDLMEGMKEDAREAKRKTRREAIKYGLMAAEGVAPQDVDLTSMATEHRQNKLLQEKLDVALDMARAGEVEAEGLLGFGAGLGLGIWDSATRLSTWDMGFSDIANNATLQQIVEKWENDPSSLTATEKRVLDGIGMATAVQELYSDQVGVGYNVGQSLPESAGFMASMALNPASGLGKSLARNAVRTYGRNSIAKSLARIGGDIAETAIMTATTGAGRVAADALERINGSSTYEIGDNGVIMYGGQKDQETVGDAVLKAIGSNFIENYSEALGEYFDPLLGMSRKVAAGGLRKINLNKWADALSDVQPSQMTASIRSLREKTKFGGIFGEIMEEEIGMALNTLFVGDNQWSDFVDLETQLTTVLSCAIMSGTLNGVEQVSSVAARRKMEKNAKNAEQDASYRFSSDTFAPLREAIDQASPEGMVDVLRDVYMSQEYTVGQKRALAEYAAARLQLQYYNAADAKARRQVNKTQQELLDAQEAGLNAQLPQFFNIARAAQSAEDDLVDYDGDWNLVEIIRSSMNRPEEMERILSDLPPLEAHLVKNYIYSRARMEGAYQGRSNRAEDYVDDFAYALEPAVVTDAEGNRTITTAIMGDRPIYVLDNNGDLAHIMRPDGSKTLVKASELTNITTSSADEVIDRYRDMYTSEYNAETENAFNHHPKTQAPQVGLQLQSPEGEVVITDVNDNMVEIVPAVYKDGQVQPKEGAEPRTITVDDAYAWQDDYYLSMDADQAYANAMAEANNMSAETAENEGTPTEQIEQSVSEEVADGQISEVQPTEEVAESVAPAVPQTARERVPKDKKGNPIYEQTDADTAWDAIVEETEGDTEMAQRVAADMLEDKKAALAKLQNGKPKKGATVAEKIANEKAHAAAIAQAQNDIAQWEAIAGTEARRREAAMSEADRYAAEMEQKNISEGLNALGEPQSLEEYVLGQLAGGSYKLRWSDKENGTKGFGSHTGLSTEEMKARLSMVDNKNGLTPEEIAHSIVENMDASFGEVDVMDVTNMVIDAVSTHASRRAMLNGMVESRAELLRQQEIAEQEAKDAWYMEQYHATEEELAAYNEYLAEFAEEIYGEDTDYEQRIATFAEIQLGEYDNQGTDAGLRSSADQGEGLASDREGGRSVGEREQTDRREVLADANGVAEAEDQGVGSSVSEESDVNFTREELENGDVRITGTNSNGQIASVATERDGKVISVDSYDDGVLFERTDYDENGQATKVTRFNEKGEVVLEEQYINGKKKVYGTEDVSEGEPRGRRSQEKGGIAEARREVGQDVQKRINEYEQQTGWTNGLESREVDIINYVRTLTDKELVDFKRNMLDNIKKGKSGRDYVGILNAVRKYEQSGERQYVKDASGIELNQPVSLETLEQLFSEYNYDEELAILFDRIFPLIQQINPKITFEVIKDGGKDRESVLGDYLLKDKHIRINYHSLYSGYQTSQEKASTIVHEMLHAVAQYAIDANERGIDMHTKLKDAAKSLVNIYNAVKGNPILAEEYGIKDVHEMLSELANSEFREKLKQIDVKGENLWERIKDVFKRLVNVFTDVYDVSAYAKAVDALDTLLDNFDGSLYAQMQEFDYEPKQAKADDGVLFREDKKELVAVHNISEDNLKKVLEVGSLIMPSIAVTKADMGHTDFGEISLLFDKSTINPSDRRNKVYGGDAWTPRFPRIGVKLNDKVVSRINKKAYELIEDRRLREVFSLSSEVYPDNIEKVISDYGVEGYYNKEWMKLAYLLDNGKKVKIPTKAKDYGIASEDIVRLAKEKRLSVKEIYEDYDFYKNNPDFVAQVKNARDEARLASIPEEQREEMRKRMQSRTLTEAAFDSYIRGALEMENDLAKGGLKEVVDRQALRDLIEKKVKTDNAEYNKWVDNLFEGIVEKRGIRNNRDWYTPSGNLRPWGQLYDPATPANILKYMLAENEQGGSGGFFDSNIMGASAETYESIEEIREKGKQRLKKLPYEEYDEWSNSVAERMAKICDDFLSPSQKNSIGGAIDAKIEITNAVAKDKTAKGIYKHMHREYPNFTMKHAKQVEEIVKEIQEFATGYFEAKPQRLVSVNEVMAAVVPSNANKEIVDALKNNGIEVVTYKKGDEESRKRVVKRVSSAMDIRFRDGKEKSLETALPEDESSFKGTAVSSDDGAKVLKDIDNAISEYENKSTQTKNFIGDVARALGIDAEGKSSKYATFEAMNGDIVTIRISDHNATVSNFDNNGEENGVSIVVSRRPNEGMNNDGDAHVVEFFYSDKKLKSSEDKPLVEILKSIKQALYSGEYKDNTGLAEREEVNERLREGMGAISDREVSYENDPIAKFQGKPRYYGKRAAAYAERERRRMENAAKEAAEMLGIEAEITTDASTLQGRKAKAKGWYDIVNKKVVVVVPNHVSMGDAVRTVLHEGVAHHGLRELFGDGFDAMLDNVYNNVAPELKVRIDAIAERTGVSTQVATEEYLASLAETTNFEEAQRRGWWAKIKQYFVKMLDKLGMPGLNLKEELTGNELRYLLWRSYQNLVEPNSYLKPLGYIDDVAKQKELKVGEYAEKKQAVPMAAEMSEAEGSEAEGWAAITMQRIEELETQMAQLDSEIAEMEADRDADDESRYDMWEEQLDVLNKQRQEIYDELEGLYSLEAEDQDIEDYEAERESEKQRQLYQKRIDNAYLKAVREGDWEEATDLFRQYVLSKAEDEGIVPMDYGVGYKGGAHSSIAKKVKEENPDAIAEAAYQMSIRIPKGSILVPMPSRTGNATYTVKLAEAIAKSTDSEVRDVLKGKARMSVYEAKQRGIKMTPEDLGMYTTEELPKGKNIVIIDNVIDKGTTALAAVSAVKGASVVAYAYTLGDKQRVATLKLAEPVTYDDNMRIIPLSQRFNKETDDIRYRTSEEIEVEVERESAALGVPVRIARSVDELPDADTRKRAVDGKLKGYYDPRTNEVVLYAPNTDDANDAKRTILHEIVGHKGLRQLIGEQRYDKAMLQLMYMLPSEVRDAVLRRAERHGWNAAIAMDEYLAEQAERDVQPTWWGKVNAKIRALLRNMGFNVILTDADVTYLLWRSRKKLQGDTAFDMATDAILKQAARKSAEAEAWNEQAFKDMEMRDFERNALSSIRHRMGADTNDYEKTVRTLGFKQSEAWQDHMRSLLVFQQALAKASGKDISDFENAYMYENRMSSANLMEMEQYRHMVYNPLLKEIHELEQMGASRESIINYLFAKSGLERNEVFARRDAKKHAEGDATKEQQLYDKYRQKDYAGLTALTRGDAQIAALVDDHSDKKTKYDRLEQNKKRGVSVSDADLKAAKKEMDDARKAMITAIEAEAQRMVDEFERAHNTDNLWDKIRNCTHTTLNISHDAGVMNDEVYNELWNQFQYYIPLRGFAETTAEDVYLYLGGNDSPYNAPIKTAYGRTSLADDPIATIGNMAESAIVEANRNRLKQRFLYMVERHYTDLASISDVWLEYDEVNDEWHTVFAQIPDDATPSEAKRLQQEFEDRMKQLAEQNPGKYANASQQPNIPYRVVKKGDRQEHHVIVKRNGKDVVITINGNPRVAQAINGLTNPEQNQGMITRITSWINRNLSANFTMRNPAFMVSNFVRDGFYTNSMVWVKENPAYAWQYNQNWMKCTAQIASLVSRYKRYEKGDTTALDMNNDMDRMFYEFMINGGETGYTVIKSVEDYKGLISGEMKKMEAGAMGTARRVADKIGDVVDTFGRWAEDTSRFAAYMTSRQLGRTVTKSIWDAKEISVNFNKKGSGNRMMGKFEQGNRWNYLLSNMSQLGRNLYVFWNAGVQGFNNFKKAAKDSPAKFTAMAGTYFTLGVIVAAAFSGDDDEDDYYNLPEYVRRNNICFKIGNGKYATLPLPIEIRAIYGLGELAYSYLSGREGLTHGEAVTKVIQQMTQVMPIDMMADGGGAMALVPSAAKPVVEVIHNVDWTGRPIYKEKTPWNQNDPTWTLAFKSTNPELVKMSRRVNEWTNKDTAEGLERPYNRGWADNRYLNNPAVWEHIAEGYLGGMATMFNQSVKSTMALWNEDLREVRNVPIVSRFVKDAGKEGRSYAARNEYYEAKNVMDSWRNEMSKAKKEVLDGSLTDQQRVNAAKLRSSLEAQYAEAFAKWKELDKQRDNLEKVLNTDISDQAKEEARKSLDDVMMQMATLVDAYR